MSQSEPGHPDELVKTLANWLRQAQSAYGSLPDAADPIEWAVHQFIEYWQRPARNAIEEIESSLYRAMNLCDTGESPEAIKAEIDWARQVVQESLRDHLGLYDWNKDDASESPPPSRD